MSTCQHRSLVAAVRRCVYCGADERGNEDGRCSTGFPHTFLFEISTCGVSRNEHDDEMAQTLYDHEYIDV